MVILLHTLRVVERREICFFNDVLGSKKTTALSLWKKINILPVADCFKDIFCFKMKRSGCPDFKENEVWVNIMFGEYLLLEKRPSLCINIDGLL